MRHAVDYLNSLYDALVSINVPSDKARAVIDAMERDMGTTLATKQDLVVLRQELRQDLQLLRQELQQGLQLLKQDLSGVQREFKQELDNRYVLLDQKIDTMQLRMTVRLGSMLFVGFGLMIAALRLWE